MAGEGAGVTGALTAAATATRSGGATMAGEPVALTLEVGVRAFGVGVRARCASPASLASAKRYKPLMCELRALMVTLFL